MKAFSRLIAALAILALSGIGATPSEYGTPVVVDNFPQQWSIANFPQNGSFSALTLNAQGAGTVSTANLNNQFYRGLKVLINITAITAGSLTVFIEGTDGSGVFFPVLQSTALTATGTTLLTVYPGLVAAANVVANDILPTSYRIRAVVVTGPVSANISALPQL